MSDLVIWEPGDVMICVECQHERGGADPPGNWFRHRPSHRRREALWQDGAVMGHLEYVRL